MSADATPAVIYAAKSTADTHGSIPTQLADGRALAEREGLYVVDEYSDEAASAYRGNRGDGLARAMTHAERIGGTLIVQHSDRLARGDGGQAQHLVELVLRARRAGVTLRSVQDPQTFDSMGLVYAALMGDRNHDDSARKSVAVRDGLKRRKERGAPVGAVPFGYRAEQVVIEGHAVGRRVVDPRTAPISLRIFQMIGEGATPGEVARRLNAERVSPPRKTSRAWEQRTIRGIVRNRSYSGENGYPRLVDPHLFKRAVDNLQRLDPVAVAARKGGRKSPEAFVLRGIARCARCAAPLYTRRYASGRQYICANSRQATGLCRAPAIPADVLEAKTLDHLADFRLDIDSWLAGRVAEVRREHAAVDRAAAILRDEAAKIARRVDAARRQHEQALDDEDDALAAAALRSVARFEGQHDEALARVAEAEARVAEWTAEPDVNAAIDYYAGIVDLIEGRVAKAQGAAELNVALRDLLAYVHVDTRPAVEAERDGWIPVPGPDGDWPGALIRATFVVRGDAVAVQPNRPPEEAASGVLVAWANPDRDGRVTSRPKTFFYRDLRHPVPLPPLDVMIGRQFRVVQVEPLKSLLPVVALGELDFVSEGLAGLLQDVNECLQLAHRFLESVHDVGKVF